MDNRWLNSLHYRPEDSHYRAPRERRGSLRGQRRRVAGPFGQPPRAWAFAVVTGLLTAFAGCVAGASRDHLWERIAPPPPVIVREATETSRISIAVDRLKDSHTAVRFTRERAPELGGLTRFWNEDDGITRIGDAHSIPRRYYAAVRRPYFDDAHAALVLDGIGRPRLYEVHVPVRWSARTLAMHVNDWAVRCRVPPSLIGVWSSFRTWEYGRLVDECRPGGVCLIVADDCGDAFFDLSA